MKKIAPTLVALTFLLFALLFWSSALSLLELVILFKAGGVPDRDGKIHVFAVQSGSPAEKAGFKDNNVIISVDGRYLDLNAFFAYIFSKNGEVEIALEEGSTTTKKKIIVDRSDQKFVLAGTGLMVSDTYIQKKSIPEILFFHSSHLLEVDKKLIKPNVPPIYEAWSPMQEGLLRFTQVVLGAIFGVVGFFLIFRKKGK